MVPLFEGLLLAVFFNHNINVLWFADAYSKHMQRLGNGGVARQEDFIYLIVEQCLADRFRRLWC